MCTSSTNFGGSFGLPRKHQYPLESAKRGEPQRRQTYSTYGHKVHIPLRRWVHTHQRTSGDRFSGKDRNWDSRRGGSRQKGEQHRHKPYSDFDRKKPTIYHLAVSENIEH
jgi:hypothetical protein